MTALKYTHPMQEDVAIFHRAFGLPDLIATPGVLPADRIPLCLALIREKGIVELGAASDVIEHIDALINTVYVALGGLVEMGYNAFNPDVDAPWGTGFHIGRPVQSESQQAKSLAEMKIHDITSIQEILDHFEPLMHEVGAHSAAMDFSMIASTALSTLTYAGIDPWPYFNEVQRANMSKLGADGKPIHSRGNSAPDLHKIYLEQTAAQEV